MAPNIVNLLKVAGSTWEWVSEREWIAKYKHKMTSTSRLLSNGLSTTRTVTAENENLVSSCNVPLSQPPTTINQKKSTNVFNGFVAGSGAAGAGTSSSNSSDSGVTAKTLSPNRVKTSSTISGQKKLIGNVAAVATEQEIISTNGTTGELGIDAKGFSGAIHMNNNPFATNFAKATASPYDSIFNRGGTQSTTASASSSSTSIKNHRPASIANGNGMEIESNNDALSLGQRTTAARPKRPHSIAGVSSPLLLLTTITGAATTTMTYSSGGVGVGNGSISSNYSDNNISGSLGQSINNNVKVNSNMSVSQNVQRMISQAHTIDQTQPFTHFINSPSRLTTTNTSTSTPPNRNGPDDNNPLYMPTTVQRRSHSTPRADANYASGIIARPRSLDRNAINALARPPPIPPSRRFSQQPSTSSVTSPSTLLINTNLSSCNLSLMKNSPNSVQYPAKSASPSTATSSTIKQQQQLPQLQQRNHPVVSGMRQSITFHGQLSRHTANSPGSYSSVSPCFPDSTAKNETDVASRSGARRKSERPVSFAYGTLRDQAFLENQLRIYSEQLRTITESVRKYSEQAKILSEMKRQQQQQQQMKGHIESPHKRNSLLQSDSNICKTQTNPAEPETPSNQLRAFLDSIRHTMKNSDAENAEAAIVAGAPLPQQTQTPDANGTLKNVEVKTPSDQLRQFLDAIRSNQLPPEEQPDDLASAASRFSKFKEKMEQARSKSTPNFDKYQSSPHVNETFTQVSNNLRIMNEDLAALTAASPNKKLSSSNYKLHLTNTAAPATPTSASATAIIQPTGPMRKFSLGGAGTVDSVLDSFTHLAHSTHPVDTVDHLRKCSEALRHTSNQLRIATMHNGTFTDSGDSSSCSTTPGSIREAVQNLLQQPRNGVQIMDDRMKLFIDILDSQSKFSQVNAFVCFTMDSGTHPHSVSTSLSCMNVVDVFSILNTISESQSYIISEYVCV